MRFLIPSIPLQVLALLDTVYAGVTIYTQLPGASSTASPIPTEVAALKAYDPLVLSPPAPPQAQPKNFGLQLYSGGMDGVSIPQSGSFLGFSIELSVADQIFGKNGSFIKPQFLNLLANIEARAGRVLVRVGGNTQEKAVLDVDGLPDGATIVKDKGDPNTPTFTPVVTVGIDLLYAMSNITSLVGAEWMLGIPFNDSTNPRFQIAQYGSQILGQHLIGLQMANEPDLYERHQKRPAPYGIPEFMTEFGVMSDKVAADTTIHQNLLMGPSVCCNWTPEQVFDGGFLDRFASRLGWISVLHYPNNNCDGSRQPQDIFSSYLTHKSAVDFTNAYIATSGRAASIGKPMILLETNTASCGGFPGVSNSFGAALWGIDMGLQLAYRNFSAAMMHVGGQETYYNPFTPPPTRYSRTLQWTVGPIFYSSLVVAEIFGSSNLSRVVDLNGNNGNEFTPAYAIYENGTPTRVALFNFVDDASGASDYTANIWIGGSGVNQPNASPPQIKVKYLTANSVASKAPFYWANQTFGGNFESNGVLQREMEVVTIPCDASSNTCSVPVKAATFALVFLSDEALANSNPAPEDVQGFSTTAVTQVWNTATVNHAVLATSNGHGGLLRVAGRGSTSFGSAGSAPTLLIPSLASLLLLSFGLALVFRTV